MLSEITQPGGEWVWDLQVGETSRFATEVYLPFSQSGPYFVVPHAQIEAPNVAVLDENSDNVAEYRAAHLLATASTSGGSSATGARFARVYLADRGKSHVRVGDPDAAGGRVRFARPSSCACRTTGWMTSTSRVTASPRRWNGTGSARASAATPRPTGRVDSTGSSRAPSGGRRRCGGPHSARRLNRALAGPAHAVPARRLPESFGRQGGLAHRAALRHHALAAVSADRARRARASSTCPLYLGLSLEAGNVWQRRSDASFGGTRKDASLFLGLDTPIGPVYLATGFEEGEERGVLPVPGQNVLSRPSIAGRLRAAQRGFGAVACRRARATALEPAGLGELLYFLKHQRRLVARPRVLVPARSSRPGRHPALPASDTSAAGATPRPGASGTGLPAGRLTRTPYGRSCSIGGRRRLCGWLIPIAREA